MSFVITVYVPDGIVMASDSRQSIIIHKQGEGSEHNSLETINSDYVYKTYLFPRQFVGINTFGEFVLGRMTVESHLKRFEEEKIREKDDVATIAEKLHDFFNTEFPGANTSFHVAGFKKESGRTIPHVYNCQISQNGLKRLNSRPGTRDGVAYGASWGGQADVVAAILSPGPPLITPEGKQLPPKPPIIWETMPVQDAIDFAIYAVRTTIDTIRFQARSKSVGGPVDVLLLTSSKATWIQRKEFRGQV